MCGPAAIPIAALVISAVGTGAAYYSADQQAKQEHDFNSASINEGSKLARQSFDLEQQQLQEQQRQDDEAASQKDQQIQKEAAQAKATARVAAGEAGVAGLSVDSLLADFDNQEAISRGALKRQSEWTRSQRRVDQLGSRAGQMQHLSGLRRAPSMGPSLAVAGLQIAGAGLDTASTISQRRGASTPTKKT